MRPDISQTLDQLARFQVQNKISNTWFSSFLAARTARNDVRAGAKHVLLLALTLRLVGTQVLCRRKSRMAASLGSSPTRRCPCDCGRRCGGLELGFLALLAEFFDDVLREWWC